jgi:hypothetical protein
MHDSMSDYEQRLTFEAAIIDADVAFLLLRRALSRPDAEGALNAAIRARRAVLDSRRAWEQLGDLSFARARFAQLQQSGHCLLAQFLSYEAEPIGHAGYASLGMCELVSRVALVEVLWKVAEALERGDQQWLS